MPNLTLSTDDATNLAYAANQMGASPTETAATMQAAFNPTLTQAQLDKLHLIALFIATKKA